MSRYVFSTATCDNVFAFNYDQSGKARTKIMIKGGHGVANKHFETPQGIMTKVADEEAAMLEGHPAFQRMAKAGFYVIEAQKADPEKVASDMEGRDGSAPLVPQDYELKGKKTPKSGRNLKDED